MAAAVAVAGAPVVEAGAVVGDLRRCRKRILINNLSNI